ncbi:hypothetical protein [Evansella tamaricis]|uniref:Rhodanese domain-containing protein n=1 Tax=Evansella tamaricis TaxID=2069301 RepID=A0ABS6JKL5_9BACI|nr:hypothetical protein [Evansella tamaricis]MBU9714193.1 hypothetical protein [Evansella tamaricis]
MNTLMIFTLTIMTALSIVVFQRYFPVRGVKMVNPQTINNDVTVLDIRDYNEAYKNENKGIVNIPLPYLNRFYSEINGEKILVLSSDSVGKNLSVRFLRKKGFKIEGYYIMHDKKCDTLFCTINRRRECREL